MTDDKTSSLTDDIWLLLNKQGWDITGSEANLITLRHGDEEYTLTVNRVAQPLAEGEVPKWPA